MLTRKLATQYIYGEITRVDPEQRIVEGYVFCNETVPGEGGIRIKRSAMEAATADYLKWGAVRSMHQPLAAGTAVSVVWDEKGALLRAHIVDDQEWRKVEARVYKGFSIGVRPELVRGNDVERLSWVENSLVDRPKDPDAIFTVARADGFDPEAEFECEVEDAADERLTLLESRHAGETLRWVETSIVKDAPNPECRVLSVERIADGIQSAPEGEPGAEPIQAGDCTITREGDLYVLNGPDGALIGKFQTEAEARQRAAEVQDAMKDGPGGQDDATDQHGKTLVLPTDRAEEPEIVKGPTIAEGEELDLVRTEDGTCWNLIRKSNGEVVHVDSSIEGAGAWIKDALARAVTAATPSLPVRENLEGKSPKERADEKPATCQRCGASCTRCTGSRAEEPEVERTETPNDPVDPVDPAIPESSDTPDPQIIARLETDNAALILRAEIAETELARVQTAQEVATRDLAAAKEQITRLEKMPAAQQPLRFAHAVTREFFANAKLDHDGETARIVTRMNEITALPPTSDLGEQAKRAQEYQLLKMALASRA